MHCGRDKGSAGCLCLVDRSWGSGSDVHLGARAEQEMSEHRPPSERREGAMGSREAGSGPRISLRQTKKKSRCDCIYLELTDC